MLKGFKDFILRGNVIDLAIAVAIGGAFTALIAAFSAAFINPVVARLLGLIGFSSDGSIDIGGQQKLLVGAFITAIITFVITAAAIYYFIVVPVMKAKERMAKPTEDGAEEPSAEVALLTEIRDSLRERG